MTGKELILYILANNLENEPVFKNGKFVGFLTVEQAAEKLNVGPATIHAWVIQGQLDYVLFDRSIYIPVNFKMPKLYLGAPESEGSN